MQRRGFLGMVAGLVCAPFISAPAVEAISTHTLTLDRLPHSPDGGFLVPKRFEQVILKMKEQPGVPIYGEWVELGCRHGASLEEVARLRGVKLDAL